MMKENKNMNLKTRIIRMLANGSREVLSRLTQGGSSFPGKLALTLDPHILASLTKNYQIAVITGTNGKTMTTALCAQMARQKGYQIVTNASGSNMIQGIVGAFLAAEPLKAGEQGLAILEIDEGSLNKILQYFQPDVFIYTNLFEDQMDRYGSVQAVANLLEEAARRSPEAQVIANGDSPYLHMPDLENERLYFGFDYSSQSVNHFESVLVNESCPKCQHTLTYKYLSYGNLGDYLCPSCGLSRPSLDYRMTDIIELDADYAKVAFDEVEYELSMGGMYNVYNALAAYAFGRYLECTPEQIQAAFSGAPRISGRQEVVEYQGKEIHLNLIKNTVGMEQTLDLIGLTNEPMSIVFIINNQPADGEDIGWLQQVDFDRMASYPIKKIVTSGMCQQAITEELERSALSVPIQPMSVGDVVQWIQQTDETTIHIVASYTAMMAFRKVLTDQGIID